MLFNYKYAIISSSFVIAATVIGTVFTFGLFLDPLLSYLECSRATLSGAWSLFLILSGFLGIFAGRLSDKFGPRKVVITCIFSLGLGFLLMSQVHKIWQLYIIYGGPIALGMSASIAPLQSTVVKWSTTSGKKGVLVGIFLMGLTVGIMIIPPVVNWLIIRAGWRNAYLALGFGNFALPLPLALFLKKDPNISEQLHRKVGCVGREYTGSQFQDGYTLRKAIFKLQFWLFCSFFFFEAFTLIMVMTHIVPYVINKGMSSTIGSTVLAVIGGVSSAMMVPEGYLTDRIGARKWAIIATSLLTIVMIYLFTIKVTLWSLFLFAVLFGVTHSSLDVLLSLFTPQIFGFIALGVIIGFANFALQTGGAAGSFIAGLIFDMTGSYKIPFQLATASALLTSIIALFIKPPEATNNGN